MERRAECTLLHVYVGDLKIGELQAADICGNGRGGNKLWLGRVDGEDIELPNLKAVTTWANEKGFEIDRRP